MKRFSTFLLEEKTPAQKKAEQLGLKYRGFGYWQDPNTGKTAYRTEGDELVPVDDEKQMELDDEEDGIAMGDPLGQQDPEAQVNPAPGSNVLGAPDPGQERPPTEANPAGDVETGWDAGPDGDNMVNGQDKPEDEIPTDAYVGSNNNFSWTAGPDGSNFKNLSFDKLIDEALHCLNEVNRTAEVKKEFPGLYTEPAALVARKRRHDKKDGLDAEDTKWWKGAVEGGTTAERKQAKKRRDAGQDLSNVIKRERDIAAAGGGDPMERTSFWKKDGHGSDSASGKAREIRNMPTMALPGKNQTKFWQNQGHDPGMAQVLAKAKRMAAGDKVDVANAPRAPRQMGGLNNAFGGPPETPAERDAHDEVMDSLMGLLQKNNLVKDKGYTGAETQIQNLQNKGGGRTERNAAAALDKLSPSAGEAELAKLNDLANQPSASAERHPGGVGFVQPAVNDRQRARDVQHRLRELPKRPQQKKDEERVKKMNEDLRELLSDPSIDLSYADLRELGSGAFGSAYLGKDNSHVLKSGQIGAKELKALHKMKDSPYFPTLMNAMFESPFSNQSSVRNNPFGASDMARTPSQENYPESSDDWAGPTAKGTYAMSAAKGRPWASARNDLYGDDKSQRVANIWRAREALHRAGVSHNDMHASNVFIDDEGNPTILDLGLANDDPMSALQEALAGYSNEDYQMARDARFDDLPMDLQDRMAQNIKGVTAKMRERLKLGPGSAPTRSPDSPEGNGLFSDPSSSTPEAGAGRRPVVGIDSFLRGAIRLKDDELKKMHEKFDFSDDEILDYISQIYDGLTPKEQSELEKRMSAAYDKRTADSEVMGNANAVRKNKGRPPLDFKHVVPSKNLDRTKSFDWDD